MIHAFLYGFILALGLIIPLGVQNIFVFNQGATQRHFIYAMPSVLTASLCDSLLIIIAVQGVSLAILAIPDLKTAILMIGFFFLMVMGYTTWLSQSNNNFNDIKPSSPKRQIGFALSVSLLNPHALIDTVGVIGTNSLHFIGETKWAYTSACIMVSCIWFFSLSIAGHFMRRLDRSGLGLNFINKISAIIIWSVALYLLYNLYQSSYLLQHT